MLSNNNKCLNIDNSTNHNLVTIIRKAKKSQHYLMNEIIYYEM